MIDVVERAGKIIGFDAGQALVRLENASGCGSCGSRGSCGSAGKAPPVIRMPLPGAPQVGDRVTVSMPSSSVALAALLGYLLPPACLLAGAVAGAVNGGGDEAAVAGAGIGLFAGLLLARLISRFTLGRGLAPAVCEPATHHGDFS